jgi:hypothetical protein
MGAMQQWKAAYFRSDGSSGQVYMELPNEPVNADIMDSILQWDSDHCFLSVNAAQTADRLQRGAQFFEINHICRCCVRPLDDIIDSSSDA